MSWVSNCKLFTFNISFIPLFPADFLTHSLAGKDLSKVSMPVTLNEPLSALQRLCEELQYSELLDEAAGLSDVHDRMVRNLG